MSKVYFDINPKIKDLTSLKNWNITNKHNKNIQKSELPIVGEWFYDYFFEKLLMNEKYDDAKIYYDEFVTFTMICNNMNITEASFQTNNNLDYYSRYGVTTWFKNYNKFKIIFNL